MQLFLGTKCKSISYHKVKPPLTLHTIFLLLLLLLLLALFLQIQIKQRGWPSIFDSIIYQQKQFKSFLCLGVYTTPSHATCTKKENIICMTSKLTIGYGFVLTAARTGIESVGAGPDIPFLPNDNKNSLAWILSLRHEDNVLYELIESIKGNCLN
uniref:Uncharacterized protein n=1 Tax=Glossina brevipalpis TaxID=37001 RepID=A0A1A9X050_9MUSC